MIRSWGCMCPDTAAAKFLYGHPYESMNAEQEEAGVEAFYRGDLSLDEEREYLHEKGIDYVVFGEREATWGTPTVLESLTLVFEENEIVVFSVEIP